MKLGLSVAPSSETKPSKSLTVKKFFSTLLTTLALAGATMLFNSACYKPFAEPLVSASETECLNAINPIPPGLSRSRGAFNKAINMLADGAAGDARLAHYYNRVAKRVSRVAITGENNSADAVAVRNITPRFSDATRDVAKRQTIARTQPISEALVSLQPTGSRQRYTVGDMPFDTNAAIEHWMNYYGATSIGRRTMTIGIERSNPYLEMARAEFRSAGIPEDLVWIAFVESVWNPRAVSPAAAGGIWQFIPSTATDYGLTVKTGNDERADPLKQTRVAATYLRDLYTIFGDWALAMAAYNSGEPRVMGAIVKNGRANFWDLCDKELLPKETRDYVPKILAAIRVASQAESYGLMPQADAVGSAGS
ncbi:MAG TPA: lytic transglycosylase domain-containing protein [Blastocatellia bacterium]|nr:lytic transglycosylase domain-containing protein [Blastocatellia bacterium]